MVFETGDLKQKDSEGRIKVKDFVMKRLDESHLQEIMAIQQVIIDHLQHPDMLASFSYDFMKAHLDTHGFIIGILVENRLIAFRNVYFPSENDPAWNLGFDLGFDCRTRNRVANLQMICVHPDFRGNGLAEKMNCVALRLLREHETRNEVCATVSPYNVWNIRILLNSGFCIRAVKSKYGGKLRYIVHQDLHHPKLCFEDSIVRVRHNDMEHIEMLLQAGYVGVSMAMGLSSTSGTVCSEHSILFKRPVNAAIVGQALKDSDTLLTAAGIMGKETNVHAGALPEFKLSEAMAA